MSQEKDLAFLEETRKQFFKWRIGKKNHNEATPAALWHRVFHSAQVFGVFKVAEELHINHDVLQKRLNKHQADLKQLGEQKPGDQGIKLRSCGSRSTITVTKVIPIENHAQAKNWEVVSPSGWRFVSADSGQSEALFAFLSFFYEREKQ